ncbi:MAG: hypothetical protein HeimC2_34270 [Candidatus Heimdallarchaeota archaeon LC_2]|nr:MAG: hypothetical protein HeimC2_34270 [Candidatus Heimdallarchaeota archaeon LC_2]
MTSWRITIDNGVIIQKLNSMRWNLDPNREIFKFKDENFEKLLSDLRNIEAGINLHFLGKKGFVYPITSLMTKAYTSAPSPSPNLCPSCGRPI